MADINVERKGASIWPWIIGLIVLALLIWALAEMLGDDEPEVAEAPVVEEVQPLPPAAEPPTPVAQAAGIPVSQIIESPATYTGQRLTGEVRVVEVPTDRGFWIEDQGERLFVIINETPGTPGETIDINPGQTLRIREAVVYGATDLTNITGQLDADTRTIAQAQPVVMGVDAPNIEMLQAAGASQ